MIKCENCRFFIIVHDKRHGSTYFCHRHPPIGGLFPAVKTTDECGDGEPKVAS